MKNVFLGKFLTFLCMFFLSSCSKPTPINGIYMDVTVDMVVRNAAGQNLLDSTTTSYYNPAKIRTFILEQGKKVEVFNPTMDAP